MQPMLVQHLCSNMGTSVSNMLRQTRIAVKLYDLSWFYIICSMLDEAQLKMKLILYHIHYFLSLKTQSPSTLLHSLQKTTIGLIITSINELNTGLRLCFIAYHYFCSELLLQIYYNIIDYLHGQQYIFPAVSGHFTMRDFPPCQPKRGRGGPRVNSWIFEVGRHAPYIYAHSFSFRRIQL